MALSGISLLSSTLLFFFALLFLLHPSVSKTTFSFELHHKLSDRVREWVRSTSGVSVDNWPQRVPNTTTPFSIMIGFSAAVILPQAAHLCLYYAMVEIGTPAVKFLVALDTSSDLFWVPCQCIQCANSTPPLSGVYSPNISTTGRYLPCSSDLCDSPALCSGTNSQCPYTFDYVSPNTSSSGVLVEDVLHLITEDSQPKAINPSVVFGCGQNQTGDLLRLPAQIGLFGLGFGLGNVSVPSILANYGLIADSFSMCFGCDGFGRINFGDKGSSDQQETPFFVNESDPSYQINVTGIRVGASDISIPQTLLPVFDTGTSFTHLSNPLYTAIGDSFHKLVKEPRSTLNSTTPFEYCYDICSYPIFVPSINITMSGGANFIVLNPTALITSQSNDSDIIGQSFMTGHRIVFNREMGVLGWKELNCDGAAIPFVISPAMSPTSAVSPSAANPEDTTIGYRTQCPATSSGHAAHPAFVYAFFTILSVLAGFF
ncbi:Aspartic proteinase-like protein 1 [Nymphaea thermarum]|nr:Aspartic proteinase-like protein 1 [Nymphaea thermarum]